MSKQYIDRSNYNLELFKLSDLKSEDKGYRSKMEYQYPTMEVAYPIYGLDPLPTPYGASQFKSKNEDEPQKPGFDMCLGCPGIKRDPDDPKKFILPRDPDDPSKVAPYAEDAAHYYTQFDALEDFIAREIKTRKNRDISFPHKVVRAQTPDIEGKKVVKENQLIHTHLGYDKEKKITTTTVVDANGRTYDFEFFRRHSKNARVSAFICIASVFFSKDFTKAFLQLRVNQIVVCKWGTDPLVKSQITYDTGRINLGNVDDLLTIEPGDTGSNTSSPAVPSAKKVRVDMSGEEEDHKKEAEALAAYL